MLIKEVNGEVIICTAEEEAKIRSEWEVEATPKTIAQIEAEKQYQANNLINYSIAIRALAQVTWDALPGLKTAFPTYLDYQNVIINRCKDLI